jgi:predicted MPP superfamily phosphohydrolase
MLSVVRIALFILITSFVIGLLGVHVVRRVSRAYKAPRWIERVGYGVAGVGLALAMFSRFFDESMPALARPFGVIGGAITLTFMVASIVLWPYELVRWLVLRVMRLAPKRNAALASSAEAVADRTATPPTPAPPIVDVGRRDVLTQLAATTALGLGVYAGGYGTVFGRRQYTVEQVPIRLAKLPRELDGFRIVQLSDIHVGLFINDPELRAARNLVREVRPDAIVLTGDLVDHDPSYAPVLGRFVRSLEGIARHGVFAVPGNHDHYAGLAPVLNALQRGGAQVMMNRGVRITSGSAAFILAGVDDVVGAQYGTLGPRLEPTFADAPVELARVLLSHNPSYFASVAHAHADLVLSGHTHGGQVTMLINPAELVLPYRFVRGLYREGESQIYVNRGFGTAGPPARVGSPPEVTCITLTT